MRIDEEFQKLIPALTPEEYKGLEASILAEGCRDALVVWGDVLVDGHNRYKICMMCRLRPSRKSSRIGMKRCFGF